jgi:D-3-phosphoglycerate dehydrogenase
MLINTARADLIDLDALAEVAPKKGLRVALDVWKREPKTPGQGYESPLFDIDGALVYGTPHIAAQTAQAQRAIAVEVVRIVRAFLVEGNVPNVVNVCAASPARYQMVVRHLDKVGVLAHVLGVIKRHGINVEEVSNTVFDGATAACLKIRLAGRPSETCIAEINAFSDEVLHVDVVHLPIRA